MTDLPIACTLTPAEPQSRGERQCCRFLRFAVAAERDGGPISLEVTGPPGTAQFLEQLVTGA